MTQALKGRKLLLVGFTLFSMFFGAGNLIFPPDLGAKAGANLWPAFLGLAISAVGLPVAGVIAVARADGLDKLAGRVHPVFAQVFMILIYLSIGPCLAIPRTASTSFAMLTPLLGSSAGLQLGYSALFFGMAFLVALRPDRLTRWLGRLLCPCLLVLILILFGGCLLHPLAAQYAAPTETYRSAVVLQGVLLRLPDHGRPCSAELWCGHCHEHPGAGCCPGAGRAAQCHPCRVYSGRAAAGGLCHAGTRRSTDRCRRARPCHRCRGTDRAGRAAVRQSGTGASCRHLYAGLLQTPVWG